MLHAALDQRQLRVLGLSNPLTRHVPQHRITARHTGQCVSYRAGHAVHPTQARKAGQSPWGWRDAVAVAVEGHIAQLAYVSEPDQPVLWHHVPLARHVSPGDPVRLHERYLLLGTPSGWFSVVIEGGSGPVPEP